MSLRLALIAVLIALALGGVLALLQRGGGSGGGGSGRASGPAPDAELAEFDAGRVVMIEVRRSEGAPVVVRRSTAGAWSLVLDGAPDWPVVPENPINLLRGLRTLTGQRAADGAGGEGSGAPPDAVRLTLQSDVGEVTRFAFDPVPLGGRIRAWANDEGPYLISDAVLTALTDPGPIGWRVPRAFPRFNEFSAIGLSIERGDRVVELARRGGVWELRAPVVAEGDQGAIVEALRTAASMPVSRFMSSTPALLERGETDPEWRISLRSRAPSGGDTPSDPSSVLEVWGALEPSGTILLGAVTTDGGERAFMAIPASALRTLSVDPVRYLPAHPSAAARADVAAIALGDAGGEERLLLERDLSRWMIRSGAEDGGPGGSQAAGVSADDLAQEVLALLFERGARPALFEDGTPIPTPDARSAGELAVPEGVSISFIVELRGLDGGVLEVVRFGERAEEPGVDAGGEADPDAGSESSDPASRLVAVRGQVVWVYPEGVRSARVRGAMGTGLGLPGLTD
ncbi:MAG: hypothetical protein ACTS3F_11615 [Phycisphaerales bacterium]